MEEGGYEGDEDRPTSVASALAVTALLSSLGINMADQLKHRTASALASAGEAAGGLGLAQGQGQESGFPPSNQSSTDGTGGGVGGNVNGGGNVVYVGTGGGGGVERGGGGRSGMTSKAPSKSHMGSRTNSELDLTLSGLGFAPPVQLPLLTPLATANTGAVGADAISSSGPMYNPPVGASAQGPGLGLAAGLSVQVTGLSTLRPTAQGPGLVPTAQGPVPAPSPTSKTARAAHLAALSLQSDKGMGQNLGLALAPGLPQGDKGLPNSQIPPGGASTEPTPTSDPHHSLDHAYAAAALALPYLATGSAGGSRGGVVSRSRSAHRQGGVGGVGGGVGGSVVGYGSLDGLSDEDMMMKNPSIGGVGGTGGGGGGTGGVDESDDPELLAVMAAIERRRSANTASKKSSRGNSRQQTAGRLSSAQGPGLGLGQGFAQEQSISSEGVGNTASTTTTTTTTTVAAVPVTEPNSQVQTNPQAPPPLEPTPSQSQLQRLSSTQFRQGLPGIGVASTTASGATKAMTFSQYSQQQQQQQQAANYQQGGQPSDSQNVTVAGEGEGGGVKVIVGSWGDAFAEEDEDDDEEDHGLGHGQHMGGDNLTTTGSGSVTGSGFGLEAIGEEGSQSQSGSELPREGSVTSMLSLHIQVRAHEIFDWVMQIDLTGI